MKSILERLYYGELAPWEGQSRECSDAQAAREERLRSRMPEELKEDFEIWTKELLAAFSKESCESFCDGVRLGAKLAAEMYDFPASGEASWKSRGHCVKNG